jgi:hypothetical protein
MKSRQTWLACTALLFCAAGALAQDAGLNERIAAAQARVAAINSRAARVDDINMIENLQRSYGYYTDKMLWEHVLDLFADDATLEIGYSGVYVGKASIREYLYSLSGGAEGPLEGVLYDHMQLQPIVTLAADGLSATARWRTVILTGVSGSGSGGNWGEGPYENEYGKEDGIWNLSKLQMFKTFIAPYEGGWLNADADAVRAYSVGNDVSPDRPTSTEYAPFPAAYTPPFSFSHPVTGN